MKRRYYIQIELRRYKKIREQVIYVLSIISRSEINNTMFPIKIKQSVGLRLKTDFSEASVCFGVCSGRLNGDDRFVDSGL